MWPKLFELLPKVIDALPHLDRFSSVADRLLSAKSTDDSALLSATEAIRRDLNRVDATHISANAVLTRKIDELATQVVSTAEDAQASRSINVALGHSIVAIERQLRALRGRLVSTLILVVILALMVGWLILVHTR